MSCAPTYSPVSTCVLLLTERCGLRCTYCFQAHEPKRMTAEIARRAVDAYLDREISGFLPRLNIVFFGGEPFLELDRIEEVVPYARKRCRRARKQIEFSATTGGTVCSPRLERIVRDARMSLLVSFDGDERASSFRPFASGRPSYALVARNLRRMATWDVPVTVRMTFHPGSLDLVANIQHVLDLGVSSVALSPVVEANWRPVEHQLERAYDALVEWTLQNYETTLSPLVTTNIMLRLIHGSRHGVPRPVRPCGAGSWLLAIEPGGAIVPCHRWTHRRNEWLGHVSGDRPSIDRSRHVGLLSAHILGCDGCEARLTCGGGCRVVALDAGLGLDGAHPAHCMLMRAHYRAATKIYDALAARGSPVLARLGAGQIHPSLTEFVMN